MGAEMQQFSRNIQNMLSKVAGVESAKDLVITALDSGVNPLDIVDALNKGLAEVGGKYESGEYFLSELIMAGTMASEIIDILRPHLEKSAERSLGKVVIGTVKGDLHDIGKNIVIGLLSSAGFTVVDLGIDVPSEMFVDAVKREKPDVVAMSCLLTTAMDEMKKVVERLEQTSQRGDFKVVVGGRPITSEFAREIRADAYGSDAIEAVRIVKALIKRSDQT
jgi:5-methyltetrahydrofolate--homocysteine methyltransferase